MMSTPVVIFSYKRPDHLDRLLKSLLQNAEASSTDVFIYSDGPKSDADYGDVARTREVAEQVSGFASVTVVKRKENIGLAKNIITGVSEVLEKYDRVIVLEDDLVVTPSFLKYMTSALNFYENAEVMSVAGYSPIVELPKDYRFTTYTINRNCSWGWATWKRRWESVDWEVKDFDSFIADKSKRNKFNESGSDLWPMLLKQHTGVIGSWSIRFCYSAFCQGLVTVYPVRSFVLNDGADGSGTNVSNTSKYDTVLFDGSDDFLFNEDISVDQKILDSFRKTYNCSLIRRFINRIKLLKYLGHF